MGRSSAVASALLPRALQPAVAVLSEGARGCLARCTAASPAYLTTQTLRAAPRATSSRRVRRVRRVRPPRRGCERDSAAGAACPCEAGRPAGLPGVSRRARRASLGYVAPTPSLKAAPAAHAGKRARQPIHRGSEHSQCFDLSPLVLALTGGGVERYQQCRRRAVASQSARPSFSPAPAASQPSPTNALPVPSRNALPAPSEKRAAGPLRQTSCRPSPTNERRLLRLASREANLPRKLRASFDQIAAARPSASHHGGHAAGVTKARRRRCPVQPSPCAARRQCRRHNVHGG
eukprot:364583-Chlamydomonas_euryale.AAC.5